MSAIIFADGVMQALVDAGFVSSTVEFVEPNGSGSAAVVRLFLGLAGPEAEHAAGDGRLGGLEVVVADRAPSPVLEHLQSAVIGRSSAQANRVRPVR